MRRRATVWTLPAESPLYKALSTYLLPGCLVLLLAAVGITRNWLRD